MRFVGIFEQKEKETDSQQGGAGHRNRPIVFYAVKKAL